MSKEQSLIEQLKAAIAENSTKLILEVYEKNAEDQEVNWDNVDDSIWKEWSDLCNQADEIIYEDL